MPSPNANWASQPTPAAQLAMLNAYIGELEAQVGPDVASENHSRSVGSLTNHLRTLYANRERLERKVESGTMVSRITVLRPR